MHIDEVSMRCWLTQPRLCSNYERLKVIGQRKWNPTPTCAQCHNIGVGGKLNATLDTFQHDRLKLFLDYILPTKQTILIPYQTTFLSDVLLSDIEYVKETKNNTCLVPKVYNIYRRLKNRQPQFNSLSGYGYIRHRKKGSKVTK